MGSNGSRTKVGNGSEPLCLTHPNLLFAKDGMVASNTATIAQRRVALKALLHHFQEAA